MTFPRRHLIPILVLLSSSLSLGCEEPQCPVGTFKIRNICRRETDGATTIDGVTGDEQEDGGTGSSSDAQRDSASPEDASSAQAAEAAMLNSSDSAAGSDSAASTANDSSTPSPECDAVKACSAGYVCTNSKCVSACEQAKCDTNASCSLVAGAAQCACNAGFIQVPASGGMPARCAADVACAALGCHTNASCEVGIDQLRHCVCKPGYTGIGTSCTPVTCDALPNPMNGSVATAGGRVFEQWAEYSCSSGYALSGGNTRRQCQADRTWSGTAPTCVLACQATNDCRPGAACLENADCGSGNTCEGNVCLAASCAGGTVSNVANLGQMRFCKEINGDLLIPMDSLSLAQIEFPYLTRVLGRIEISRPTEFIAKRTVTFGALTQVSGSVIMTEDTRGDTELRFPRLERVDGSVAFARINSIKVLDLSALTTVGELGLQYLYEPMDLRIGALRVVTRTITVMWVPLIGYRPIFERLANPAQVSVGQGRLIIQVGCSLPDNKSPDCPAP